MFHCGSDVFSLTDYNLAPINFIRLNMKDMLTSQVVPICIRIFVHDIDRDSKKQKKQGRSP